METADVPRVPHSLAHKGNEFAELGPRVMLTSLVWRSLAALGSLVVHMGAVEKVH